MFESKPQNEAQDLQWGRSETEAAAGPPAFSRSPGKRAGSASPSGAHSLGGAPPNCRGRKGAVPPAVAPHLAVSSGEQWSRLRLLAGAALGRPDEAVSSRGKGRFRLNLRDGSQSPPSGSRTLSGLGVFPPQWVT